MLTFLFWNLRQRRLTDHLASLAKRYEIDFLILAECQIPGPLFLEACGRHGLTYYEVSGLPKSLALFTRLGRDCLIPQHDSPGRRISIRKLRHADHPEILITVAHLPSQLHTSVSSMDMECVTLSRIIREQEESAGHRRTLLVGDLNVNPFNNGVVASEGLHAVMTRDIASRQTRTIGGVSYPFFYNPMWSHFGDNSDGPAGTYFYDRAESISYFWNMFDQVLLRPELAARFDPSRLKIITEVGSVPLATRNGRPNTRVGSDHFPLLFQLDI